MDTVNSTKILKIRYLALAMTIAMGRLSLYPFARSDDIAIG